MKLYRKVVFAEDYFGRVGLCEDPPAEPTDPPEDPPAEPTDPPEFLTKEQAGSWFGRIASKQLEEKILPMMQQMSDKIESMGTPKEMPLNPVNQMDEELTELILSGKTTEALERFTRAKEQAKSDLSNKQTNEVNKLVVSYSEDPIYDSIQSDMDKIAKEKVKEGWPPKAAVIHAREVAEKNMLNTKLYGEPHEGLEMSSGGKATPRTKKVELPTIYKQACERDIADGIVKDEKEFIAMLSPKIKKMYDL